MLMLLRHKVKDIVSFTWLHNKNEQYFQFNNLTITAGVQTKEPTWVYGLVWRGKNTVKFCLQFCTKFFLLFSSLLKSNIFPNLVHLDRHIEYQQSQFHVLFFNLDLKSEKNKLSFFIYTLIQVHHYKQQQQHQQHVKGCVQYVSILNDYT